MDLKNEFVNLLKRDWLVIPSLIKKIYSHSD